MNFNTINETMELIKKYQETSCYPNHCTQNLNSEFLKIIGNTKLLTEEEEKKCWNDLKIIDKLNLFRTNNNLNDLGRIFTSLTNNDNYKDVLKLLDILFSLNRFNEDKILRECLMMYKKEIIILNRPLTKEELNKLFKTKLFKDFNEYKEMNNKQLLEQINLNVKYEVTKEKLFVSNLRLVLKNAYKYKISDEDIIDLLTEGSIGLMKAIDKFDITLNNKFSTYATYWINTHIRRSNVLNSTPFKISSNFLDELNQINYKISVIEANLKRTATIQEISEALNMSETELAKYLNFGKNIFSLNEPINDNEKSNFEEFVESKSNYKKVDKKILREEIKKMFKELETNNVLTKEEIQIIKLRFGINQYNEPYKIKDISKMYDTYNTDIRRKIENSLKKIRKYSRTNSNIKELESFVK